MIAMQLWPDFPTDLEIGTAAIAVLPPASGRFNIAQDDDRYQSIDMYWKDVDRDNKRYRKLAERARDSAQRSRPVSILGIDTSLIGAPKGSIDAFRWSLAAAMIPLAWRRHALTEYPRASAQFSDYFRGFPFRLAAIPDEDMVVLNNGSFQNVESSDDIYVSTQIYLAPLQAQTYGEVDQGIS